jgi:two-component system sensor histidine kinase TtrS
MSFLRPLRRLGLFLGLFLIKVALLLPSSHAGASNAAAVRIGVLAYKGADAVQEDWSYVRIWLDAAIPGRRFTHYSISTRPG